MVFIKVTSLFTSYSLNRQAEHTKTGSLCLLTEHHVWELRGIKYLALEFKYSLSSMDGETNEEDYKEMVCVPKHFKIRPPDGFGGGCDN